jgi:glycosyltransferase involved in cell wall biosynthesis
VILHVGSIGPRKNLPTVVRSLAALRAAGIPAWLLQVGGAFSEVQTAEIAALGVREWVTPLGATHEDILRSAYGAADVLLFPSLYEGFGFPILEAMASGLPTIASSAGALPEVGGDAGVIVDGHETEPYVTALRRVLDNPSWRDQLVSRGKARAQGFTWAAAARKTAEVYRKIA